LTVSPRLLPGVRGAALALLGGALLAACSEGSKDMRVPDPPPTLASPPDYAFGDAIGAADNAAIGRVIDALQPRFGRPTVARYTAPRETDFTALEAYYDARAEATGWRPMPEISRSLAPMEHAIAYQTDDAAFAVIWLEPRADSPITPVNVVRFGE
jgi:hypothetical protein